MFQFLCRFAFYQLSSFEPDTENNANFDAVSSKHTTLTLFSKEDKILIKSLQECKGYNVWQFIHSFIYLLNKTIIKSAVK